MRARHLAPILLATALVIAPALGAQLPDRIERQAARAGYVNLSGPRVGALFLAGDDDRLRDRYDVDRVVTQLGFAMETRFFAVPEGPTGVAQLVALAGIADGGEFVPSGMLLMGVRSRGGLELSVGPWFGERDASPVVQLGAVLRAGYMRIPVTMQVMPTSNGTRLGLLTGFNAFR